MKMGENGEIAVKNGEKWGEIGEISGMAHGMWVVEGCDRMWSRKMRPKWEENGRKMER